MIIGLDCFLAPKAVRIRKANGQDYLIISQSVVLVSPCVGVKSWTVSLSGPQSKVFFVFAFLSKADSKLSASRVAF